MKNLSGVSLLHVLPAARRLAAKLPLPPAVAGGGAAAEVAARSLAWRVAAVLGDLGLDGAALFDGGDR